MTRDLRIRRVATAALAASAFLMAATAAYPLVRSRVGPAAAPGGYAVGDQIDVPRSVYEGAPQTLVIFARTRCDACQRMKPLLSKVIAQLSAASTTRIVVLAGRADAETGLRYITEIGLDKDRLVTVDLTALRLTLVPTIVLVGGDGKVRYVRAGAPSSPREEEAVAREVMSFASDR